MIAFNFKIVGSHSNKTVNSPAETSDFDVMLGVIEVKCKSVKTCGGRVFNTPILPILPEILDYKKTVEKVRKNYKLPPSKEVDLFFAGKFQREDSSYGHIMWRITNIGRCLYGIDSTGHGETLEDLEERLTK